MVAWLNPKKGKLGLVHRDGAALRLIGDSSVRNANAMCRIEERVELPGLRDVAACTFGLMGSILVEQIWCSLCVLGP